MSDIIGVNIFPFLLTSRLAIKIYLVGKKRTKTSKQGFGIKIDDRLILYGHIFYIFSTLMNWVPGVSYGSLLTIDTK